MFFGTIQRNVLNWLRIVVDSEKGGSKSGASRPVRRGTMRGYCKQWLTKWLISVIW